MLDTPFASLCNRSVVPNLTVIDGDLARSGRARRSVLPDVKDLRGRLRKPSRRSLQINGLSIEVRREPFSPMQGEHDELTVYRRETLCAISRGEGEIGCVHFVEFQPPACCPNSHFWNDLDGNSTDDAHLAETLLEAWAEIGPDVSDYGNIVELRTVGLWTRLPDGAHVIETLVERLCPKHSILVVQASPLTPRDWREIDAIGFERRDRRRRAALMRMCGRQLGLQLFPSKAAAERGWMWRPRKDLAAVIQAPAAVPIEPSVWL